MPSPRALLALALLVPGLAGAAPALPAADRPAVAPPAPAVFDSLSRGIEEARKRGNARLFVFVQGRDCKECERMDSLILPARNYTDFVEDKVVVRVDIGSAEGATLGEKYGVTTAPAWIVMTPDGVLSWLHRGTTAQTPWLEMLADSERRWVAYQKRLAEEAARPSDGLLVFENAQETYRRFGEVQAEKSFRRLAASPETPPALREQSLAYLASIAINARRPDEARGYLETLLKNGQDPVLRQRAELRLVEIEIAKEDAVAARARLDRFVKEHPGVDQRTVDELDRVIMVLSSPSPAEGPKK